MKSYLFASCTAIIVMLASCNGQSGKVLANNQDAAADTLLPACITAMINKIKQEPVHNPPTTIKSYTFKNQRVFFVSADCCDQMNLLYDSICNQVCAPSGGFTGKGDGKCPDFETEKKDEQLVWQDSR